MALFEMYGLDVPGWDKIAEMPLKGQVKIFETFLAVKRWFSWLSYLRSTWTANLNPKYSILPS